MNKIRRTGGLVAAVLLLSSCGIFGEKEDEDLIPKELVKIENSLDIKRLWSVKLGAGSEFLLTGLRPASDGNSIFAASRDGNVVALDPASGKQRWKTQLDIELSAGPGVNEGAVVLASVDGDIIVLDAKTGAESWRVDIGGESLAQPVVKDGLVIVQSIDNRLQALSLFDGKQKWELEQTMPALTMRGASSPVAVGNNIVAGFDNGRILAVSAETGDIEWDSMMSLPTGRSDLDRLADVDGAIAIVGQDVYAAGYQGRMASLDAESGQVLWSREVSTQVGLAANWSSVYTTLENGEVMAMDRNSGNESWRNDDLLRRQPSLPVPFHTAVVVGDFEGYLHFLSSIDGEVVARLRFGKSAVSGYPVVFANTLYVQSEDGSLAAYTVVQAPREQRAPDIADTEDAS